MSFVATAVAGAVTSALTASIGATAAGIAGIAAGGLATGALGAGLGAGVSAATGGDPGQGALIGGVGGLLGGAGAGAGAGAAAGGGAGVGAAGAGAGAGAGVGAGAGAGGAGFMNVLTPAAASAKLAAVSGPTVTGSTPLAGALSKLGSAAPQLLTTGGSALMDASEPQPGRISPPAAIQRQRAFRPLPPRNSLLQPTQGLRGLLGAPRTRLRRF